MAGPIVKLSLDDIRQIAEQVAERAVDLWRRSNLQNCNASSG
jgi:hypothetical protein